MEAMATHGWIRSLSSLSTSSSLQSSARQSWTKAAFARMLPNAAGRARRRLRACRPPSPGSRRFVALPALPVNDGVLPPQDASVEGADHGVVAGDLLFAHIGL